MLTRTIFDEYTRHEETAIFCLAASPVGNKIKKIKQSFRYNLILYYNSHDYSVFDKYVFYRRLLSATHFRYTLFKVF